ncbi:MAG: alpha/beta fold hydrolase [Bdellovibrionota bacterium]
MMRFGSHLLFFATALSSLTALAENRDLYYEGHDGSRQHAIHFIAEHPRSAILFVHGLQSHAEWMRASGVGEKLAARGISVMAFDRRGSGRSATERGYAASGKELLEDLNDAVVLFRKELRKQGVEPGRDIQLNLMANCFGVRIAVPYAFEAEKQSKNPFASLILIAPSTQMRPEAEYNFIEKLQVMLKGSHESVATPLKDEWFVSSGPGLTWIKQDALGLHRVTVGLLKSVRGLTTIANRELPDMTMPLMIFTASRDKMVDGERVKRELYRPYRGEKRLRELDSEHSLEFGPARDRFVEETVRWVLR